MEHPFDVFKLNLSKLFGVWNPIKLPQSLTIDALIIATH